MGKSSTVWLTKVTIEKLHSMKTGRDTIESVILRLIAVWELQKNEKNEETGHSKNTR